MLFWFISFLYPIFYPSVIPAIQSVSGSQILSRLGEIFKKYLMSLIYNSVWTQIKIFREVLYLW